MREPGMKSIEVRAFLDESRIELHVLERWIAREWIVAGGDAGAPELSEADAARALLIRDLSAEMGVNDAGIDVVLHLVDQVHGLRRALETVRLRMRDAAG